MIKFAAATASLALITTSAIAQPLTDQDKRFVMAQLAAVSVKTNCPGYEIVDGGLLKYGDREGVDAFPIANAVTAAIGALTNENYDRKNLIPEVTRFTQETLTFLITAMGKSKSSYCRQWGDIMVNQGIMSRK